MRLRTTKRPPVNIPAVPDSCGGIDSDDDTNFTNDTNRLLSTHNVFQLLAFEASETQLKQQ